MLHAIIVGGSSAGLSAALLLGRARRRVLVVDSGKPCNRFSHASHGFFTRDGTAPTELLALGREQLAVYPTVELLNGQVVAIQPTGAGFQVTVDDGTTHEARKILLAYGLKDELPPLAGIEPLWGRSVFHCPYCDGWEVRDHPIAVYGNHDMIFHQVSLLHNWTRDLVLCTGERAALSDEQRATLSRHGVEIIEKGIARLDGENGQLHAVVFEDGTQLARRAMFIRPASSHQADFAQTLGCATNPNGQLEVDRLGQTSVPGVYAAGDIAQPFRSVAAAVAQGSFAAAGINHALVVEDFV